MCALCLAHLGTAGGLHVRDKIYTSIDHCNSQTGILILSLSCSQAQSPRTLELFSSSHPSALVDAVFAIPELTNLLPPEGRAALAGCNRQLRAHFHNITRVIMLNDYRQLNTVSRIKWPELALITLRWRKGMDIAFPHFFRPADRLQLLGQLVIWPGEAPRPHANGSVHVVLLVIHQTKEPEQGQATYQHLAPAFLHLQNPCFQSVSRLVLRSSKLDAKSLAQLTAMHWPLMSYLNVSGNDFDSPAMTQLAKGAWPQLYELVLSNNQIDTAAMAELVHGNWPLLSTLDLSANPLSEPAALGMLKEANWLKIQYLLLSGVQLSPPCVQSLLQVDWSLWQLDLSGAGLDSSAILVLAQSRLSTLLTLVLSDNKLAQVAISHLVSASFPQLHTLDLPRNRLDMISVEQLVRGKWPKLFTLNLTDNCLDNNAIKCLAQGSCWPALSTLHLRGNDVSAVGVQALTETDWKLRSLTGLCLKPHRGSLP